MTLLILVLLLLLPIATAVDTNPAINQNVQQTTSSGSMPTFFVNINNTEGPWDGSPAAPYQYINQAVANATTGYTIYVYPGTYHEHIILDKKLTLQGTSQHTTIIDGDYTPIIIEVNADACQIQQFTIRNSGGYHDNAGIMIDSDQCIIHNCTFHRTKTGVYLNRAQHTLINTCNFHTNGGGILLLQSSHTHLTNCTLSHNALGLHVEHATNTHIKNIDANTCGIGCFINNSDTIEIIHSAFYDNNDNQGGIFITHSHNIHITNCNIRHNGLGIKATNSTRIWITYCTLYWNTHFAVIIDQNSADIIILNSHIHSNFRYGIYLEEHSTAHVQYCNIHNNTLEGIYAENSLCTATNNWWGALRGPSFFDVGRNTRITLIGGHVWYIPWKPLSIPNCGATWALHPSHPPQPYPSPRWTPIKLPGKDTDDDSVPDWWENKWGYDPTTWEDHQELDPDNDALNNIEECYTDEYGSNPFYKDVFIEFDWMTPQQPGAPSNKPSEMLLHKVQILFEYHDIHLHVDTGQYGGGEEIPDISGFSYADLRDLYWDYFLHNDLNNPRKGIFHYCLVCNYGPGAGFMFMGWDQLDSFDISASMQQEKQPQIPRETLILHGAIHELGHTFGLTVEDHGGNDNMGATNIFSRQWFKYHNYKSVMNYLHTYRVIAYSDGDNGPGDFNDWEHIDLSFFKNSHLEWPLY